MNSGIDYQRHDQNVYITMCWNLFTCLNVSVHFHKPQEILPMRYTVVANKIMPSAWKKNTSINIRNVTTDITCSDFIYQSISINCKREWRKHLPCLTPIRIKINVICYCPIRQTFAPWKANAHRESLTQYRCFTVHKFKR